jgi:hypothetical protein
MKTQSYMRFIVRLTLWLGVFVMLMIVGCLLIGAVSTGSTISAFTTNTSETTDVWIMDVSRMKYVHLQVTGEQNNIPVWSTQERRLIYYPRSQ